MEALGASLANHSSPGIQVHVSGVLGAGKTTLVRGFLRALGHSGPVKSPTFTMVESYYLPPREVHHFDLYRLADAQALYFLGFEDYLVPGSDCFVEWPERGAGYLPRPDLSIEIEVGDAERRVRIAAPSEIGREVLRLIIKYMN